MSLIFSSAGLRFKNLITYPEIKIAEESFSFMLGKSGCGKSTYLKILNRTVLPAAGIISYRGKEIQSFPVLAYRQEVMLVPQEVFLFDGTIRENFHNYSIAREKEPLPDKEILQFLQLCCADFALDSQCRSLSGGERQRVFLSIFLSCLPRVLLLDEPTAALDERTSQELLANIKAFCKKEKITTLCVCHNEELVQRFSDDTVRLEGKA